MNLSLNSPPRIKRKRKMWGPRLMLLCFFVLVVGSIGIWYVNMMPSTERVAPFDGQKNAIVFNGEAFAQPYRVEKEQIMLPFDFIKTHLDPNAFWDEPTNSLIITTKDKVLKMESGQLTAYLNKTPVSLQIPLSEQDGVRYVPYAPLEKLYPFQLRLIPESNVLIVEKFGSSIQEGKVETEEATQPLRTGASYKKPIASEVTSNAIVYILAESDGWFRVQADNGIIGYLPKEVVTLTTIKTIASPAATIEKEAAVWKPLGKKIVLAWEQVTQKTADPAKFSEMQALNVVSPTWFELKDDKGTLRNKADASYVKWAHGKGYKVWGLVSNGFNPDWTKSVLGNYNLREKMIAQIIQYAEMYNLDGINLDFENVYIDEKDKLVQFVRELTPYMHEQGLTVSMDVTIKSTSDRWSRFYDRERLAQTVDYMAVMTYDEHPASSQVAGSVASLPWTENGLKGVLEDVPHQKLLLGVPFYTRLWKEEKLQDGSVKVSSKALSMTSAQKWINERKLTPKADEETGQLFVQFTDPQDGFTYKMWLEDVSSIQKRLDLVHKYKLAGAAVWRRGYETPDIWTTIDEQLKPGK